MAQRPKSISGFPEWLPEIRLVEQKWMDTIRRVFESYGFCSVETPSVEEIEVLAAKGEVDKEIYVLRRLQADLAAPDEGRLALHYDLTVPLARYVAQHFAELVFPFKRHQIQRVWRGERPQEGRFREFYQADIDVVAVDSLPLTFDAELPVIAYEALAAVGTGNVQLQVSNRKILDGYLRGLGVEDPIAAIRLIDKLDKMGEKKVLESLSAIGLDERALAIGRIRTGDASFVEKVRALGVSHALLDQGLDELAFVMQNLRDVPAVADLSIARGFDYYTGSIYEARLVDFPQIGSICSGGRYDDLAGSYINRKLPGVGISIGLTRLFAKLVGAGVVLGAGKSPTQVLVVYPKAELLANCQKVARTLRDRGLNVELYHAPSKLGDQIRYASRKGIPFVWFPPFEEGGKHEVKNLVTSAQAEADPSSWNPDS
jgi:histidyl-tRNA synthetase